MIVAHGFFGLVLKEMLLFIISYFNDSIYLKIEFDYILSCIIILIFVMYNKILEDIPIAI